MKMAMHKRFHPCWSGLLLFLVIGLPLQAQDVDELQEDGPMQQGHRAYVSGNYQHAARLWKPLAEQGVSQAQFYLSTLYARGNGLEEDPVAALSWLTRAAHGGYPAAQFNLGNRFFQGLWVKRDYDMALAWWRKAADNGVPRAAYNIGGLYFQGKGVKKDKGEALRWYRRAAEAGSTEAKVVLAKLEEGGEPAFVPSAGTTPAGSRSQQQARVAEPSPRKPLPVAVSTPEESAVWIREQPDKHYSIQLFAANTVPAIEAYLQDFVALDRLAVFGFARDDKPYFAVIHGSYPSLAAARERAAALTGTSTWVRSFAGIKKIMVE
jgi:hypothetical protein